MAPRMDRRKLCHRVGVNSTAYMGREHGPLAYMEGKGIKSFKLRQSIGNLCI